MLEYGNENTLKSFPSNLKNSSLLHSDPIHSQIFPPDAAVVDLLDIHLYITIQFKNKGKSYKIKFKVINYWVSSTRNYSTSLNPVQLRF